MPQYRSPLFADVTRLMSDAVGVAQGVRREAETLAKTQIERALSTMNVVTFRRRREDLCGKRWR